MRRRAPVVVGNSLIPTTDETAMGGSLAILIVQGFVCLSVTGHAYVGFRSVHSLLAKEGGCRSTVYSRAVTCRGGLASMGSGPDAMRHALEMKGREGLGTPTTRGRGRVKGVACGTNVFEGRPTTKGGHGPVAGRRDVLIREAISTKADVF